MRRIHRQDRRRDLHGRKDRSDIGLVPDPRESSRDVGRARVAARLRHECDVNVRQHVSPGGLVLDHRSSVRERAPQLLDVSELGLQFRWGSAPRIVGRRGEPGVRFHPHHRVHPVRLGSREQRVRSPGFEDARQDRSLRTDSVHHRQQVGDPRLEVGECHVAARQPDATVIMHDHPRERADLAVPKRAERLFRLDVDVARPVRLPDHIDRPIAEDLVSDIDPV